MFDLFGSANVWSLCGGRADAGRGGQSGTGHRTGDRLSHSETSATCRNLPDHAGGRAPLGRSVLARPTSLSLAEEVTLDEWKHVGQQIFLISDSSAWWLGDWLNYGRDRYPDRYRRALAETALDYQTLRNYAWVAGRFSHQRRRAALSFQHHAEVASLPEGEQERWLDEAERRGWTRNRLRAMIRPVQGRSLPTLQETVRISVRTSADQMRVWEEAAGRTALELHEWMVVILNEAAGSGG
ncbi:LmbU family transcriptional regulator [Nonomuraea rubra]|uniref:LmbU family transcriptional regulator n=1 Tax=Nonomuraea rubra TaxID=46180 RepID=UPI003616BD00